MREFIHPFWLCGAAVLFAGCATDREQAPQTVSVEKVPLFRAVLQADGSVQNEPTDISLTITRIPVGFRPIGLQWADGALWATGESLAKLDPASNQVVATFAEASDRTAVTETRAYRVPYTNAKLFGEASGGAVAIGEGGIWKLERKHLVRLDCTNGNLVAKIPVTADTIAVGEGSVWAFHFGYPVGKGRVYRIDPKLNQVVATIEGVGCVEGRLGVGAGAVWVMTRAMGTFFDFNKLVMGECSLVRVNPAENRVVETVPFGAGRGWNLAFGEGTLWATQSAYSTIASTDHSAKRLSPRLLRIDPATNRIIRVIPVVRDPAGLAVGGGSVWVSSIYGEVCRVDPRTNQPISTFDVAQIKGQPVWGKVGLVFAQGSLWVAGLPAPFVYRVDF
jgi:hypothetical protein